MMYYEDGRLIKLSNEIWKDVKGYEGFYMVSSLGRVKSVPRVILRNKKEVRLRGKVLNQAFDKSGYLIVSLNQEGRGKSFTVHSLVARAFKNYEDNQGLYIDHENECKHDNRLSNLQFLSNRENIIKSNDVNSRGSSQYPGAFLETKTGKWRAAIKFNGVKVNLGSYQDEEDAGLAYSIGYALKRRYQGDSKKFRELVKSKIPYIKKAPDYLFDVNNPILLLVVKSCILD